jgi:hypothetical protein
MADTATGTNVGYTVTWENVNCRLKSGGMFSEKKGWFLLQQGTLGAF